MMMMVVMTTIARVIAMNERVIMKVREHQGNIPSLKSNEIFVKKTYWVYIQR